MVFPQPVMRKSQLIKMGFSPKLLDAAFRERGQKFAYKINPGKQNSPIVFETDGFSAWLAKRIRAAAAERELHMRA